MSEEWLTGGRTLAINLNRVRGDRSPYRLVVREGDTLHSLSELLEVEPAALRAANPNVDLDELVPGMELIIPESSVIAIGDVPAASADTEDEAGSAETTESSSDNGGSGDADVAETTDNVAAISDGDGDDDRIAADEAADGSKQEPPADAVAAGEGERAQDAAETQNATPQHSESEQNSSAGTEPPRPRLETISWKPFPKI